MISEKKILEYAYDAGVDEEYNRLTATPLQEIEFLLISELLSEYIADGSTVIDIGSGSGRYAESLLERNCRVGVTDLSGKSLEAFTNRINGNYPNQLLFSKKSCATEIEWIEDGVADAVLLMGPLYHLTCEIERLKAIEQSYRILKPGGYVFAVLLSPYPKLNPLMETTEKMLLDQSYLNTVQSNCITEVQFKGFNVKQYRCWPTEIKSMMEQQGYVTERIRNIEGVGEFLVKNNGINFSSLEKKEFLLNTLRSTCENPNLIGITSQYLYVGKK